LPVVGLAVAGGGGELALGAALAEVAISAVGAALADASAEGIAV
jgi:hypothetical protein